MQAVFIYSSNHFDIRYLLHIFYNILRFGHGLNSQDCRTNLVWVQGERIQALMTLTQEGTPDIWCYGAHWIAERATALKLLLPRNWPWWTRTLPIWGHFTARSSRLALGHGLTWARHLIPPFFIGVSHTWQVLLNWVLQVLQHWGTFFNFGKFPVFTTGRLLLFQDLPIGGTP